jgi:hypothetical protein
MCSVYCRAVKVARSVDCCAVEAGLSVSSQAVEIPCSVYCRTIEVARLVDCRAVEAALSVSSRAADVACSVYRRAIEVTCSVDYRTIEDAFSVSSCALIFICAVTRSSSSSRRITHRRCSVAIIFIIAPSHRSIVAPSHTSSSLRCRAFIFIIAPLYAQKCDPVSRDSIWKQNTVSLRQGTLSSHNLTLTDIAFIFSVIHFMQG